VPEEHRRATFNAGVASRRQWEASLDLRFALRGEHTVLVHNAHRGPLRLIKTLVSDDEALDGAQTGAARGLDAIIVHPPGGLADGDSLRLEIELAEGARVRSTTPGSQKWYRGQARAQTRVTVGPNAQFEWLPQPTIIYDRAHVDQSLCIDLAAGATTLGSECLVLGRQAMGERFSTGHLRQSIRIAREGRLVWQEATDAPAQSPLWNSAAGWAGRIVCASVWALVGAKFSALEQARPGPIDTAPASPGSDAAGSGFAPLDGDRLESDTALVAQWRSALAAVGANQPEQPGRLLGGASAVAPGVVLAKILGDDASAVLAMTQRLWALARPIVTGRAARPLRIWAT